jgi:hypothetical protein
MRDAEPGEDLAHGPASRMRSVESFIALHHRVSPLSWV